MPSKNSWFRVTERNKDRGGEGVARVSRDCRLLSRSRSVSTVGVLTALWDQQWLKAVSTEVYLWTCFVILIRRRVPVTGEHACEMMGLSILQPTGS